MDTAVAPADSGKEHSLEKRLQQIITGRNLSSQREQVQRIALCLEVSVLDCAAALMYLQQPRQASSPKIPANSRPAKEAAKPHYRTVRYRLDIGSQHKVSREEIQAVLIEESGVDRKRIGRVDIRDNYTLVELPDGMPADIFQLLSEATIGDRKLAIKRVKPNRRKPRDSGDNR